MGRYGRLQVCTYPSMAFLGKQAPRVYSYRLATRCVVFGRHMRARLARSWVGTLRAEVCMHLFPCTYASVGFFLAKQAPRLYSHRFATRMRYLAGMRARPGVGLGVARSAKRGGRYGTYVCTYASVGFFGKAGAASLFLPICHSNAVFVRRASASRGVLLRPDGRRRVGVSHFSFASARSVRWSH